MTTNNEEKQKLQLEVYGAALEMAHLMAWEFNIPERTVTAWSDTLNRNYKGFPGKVFTGVPESLFAYMPDAAERAKLQKTYETVCKGIPAGCEVWHLNGPDGELVCDRLYYSTIIKKDGKVLKVDESLTPAYEFKGDELYVRARVECSDGAVAWTQPVFVKNK